SKGNYTPPEVILDRVRLEFAALAAAGAPPAAGRARVAREDYEGLDLHGERASLRVYRSDGESDSLALELEPAELPRRVIELAPADARRLGVELAPATERILPREVPGLPVASKVWVDDPKSPAPGADAFRWFFFSSNPPWSPTRHSLQAVRDAQRELPL